jgi:hypothetical protein
VAPGVHPAQATPCLGVHPRRGLLLTSRHERARAAGLRAPCCAARPHLWGARCGAATPGCSRPPPGASACAASCAWSPRTALPPASHETPAPAGAGTQGQEAGLGREGGRGFGAQQLGPPRRLGQGAGAWTQASRRMHWHPTGRTGRMHWPYALAPHWPYWPYALAVCTGTPLAVLAVCTGRMHWHPTGPSRLAAVTTWRSCAATLLGRCTAAA